ncbi:cathepsin B-like cysteine proteinase 3 [Adelges cooleyi]|uniref:cathepsin B-like cysteine proteinase 3 n=1 Tax=Adelges cooleyi TaxID=133065 RepID=UPI00218005D4|nr:cathepsin B-like cysteine proteinase 3 [Adelges cooleyi]
MSTKIVIGFCLLLCLNFSGSLIIQNPAVDLEEYNNSYEDEGLFSGLSASGENSGAKINDLEPQNKEFLPKNFDARTRWPRCHSIGAVRFQSNCNSDWAIAVAGVFSDRLWISSKGNTAVNISFEHILTCARSDGCIEGEPEDAWDFLENNGAVTGRDYGYNKVCQPYEIAPCGIYGYPNCDKPIADTPTCRRNCTNRTYKRSYEADLYRTRRSYKTIPAKNESDIMNEIYYNGPVAVIFDGYKDLFRHVAGVYRKMSDEFVRRVSMKIIGWGYKGSLCYWLVVNSWGERWAEQGLIKIERATLSTLFGNITAGYA